MIKNQIFIYYFCFAIKLFMLIIEGLTSQSHLEHELHYFDDKLI